MKSYELAEIDRLPSKYKPLTAWGYFWLTVLYAIPVIGWIFLVVFSFSDGNVNRRSHARSCFCPTVLVILVAIVLIVLVALNAVQLPFLS